MSDEQQLSLYNRRTKFTNEQIIEAYKATGSVWAAGKKLGLGGQTVHERLQAIGYPLASRKWTKAEVAELRILVEAGVRLGEIATRLGRPYSGVAGKASNLGIRSNQSRPKKLPRGGGWDKATTLRHMKALDNFGGKFTQYARSNGLNIELLAKALEKHCPDQWRSYVASRSDLPQKECPYCHNTFIPGSGKQTHCSRQCSTDARVDASYFGGKRRTTIGLAEGICQICGRKPGTRLSSHHVLGKENDPDNDWLVALCTGCHNLVSLLGGRNFDREAWESLISLAWLRKNGADMPIGHAIWVSVDIDVGEDDECYGEDDSGEGQAS